MRWTRGRKAAQRTEYGGRKYASKSEAYYAAHLDDLLKRGRITGFSPQYRVDIRVGPGETHVCDMVVDFLVAEGGLFYYVEIKGYPEPVWQLKRKLFEALYPERPYVVIQAKDVLNGAATACTPAEYFHAGARTSGAAHGRKTGAQAGRHAGIGSKGAPGKRGRVGGPVPRRIPGTGRSRVAALPNARPTRRAGGTD